MLTENFQNYHMPYTIWVSIRPSPNYAYVILVTHNTLLDILQLHANQGYGKPTIGIRKSQGDSKGCIWYHKKETIEPCTVHPLTLQGQFLSIWNWLHIIVVSKGKENTHWQVQKMLLWTLPYPMLPSSTTSHCWWQKISFDPNPILVSVNNLKPYWNLELAPSGLEAPLEGGKGRKP